MEDLVYEKNFREDNSSRNIINSVIRYVLSVLIFIVVIFMLIGYHVYFVGGWSMQPVIDYMDLIIVNQGVDKYNLQEGDIVTFEISDGFVNTHRIININYDSTNRVVSYTTKGDNPNITEQETFTPDKIIGKVVTIFGKPLTIHSLGYVILDFQNNKLVSIIFVIVLYVFFFATPNPRKYVVYEP